MRKSFPKSGELPYSAKYPQKKVWKRTCWMNYMWNHSSYRLVCKICNPSDTKIRTHNFVEYNISTCLNDITNVPRVKFISYFIKLLGFSETRSSPNPCGVKPSTWITCINQIIKWDIGISSPEYPIPNGMSECINHQMNNNWLVVSTYLKNISQIGNLTQMGVNIKNVWNHQLDNLWYHQHHHTGSLPWVQLLFLAEV